jgi:predicted dehydrogenase
MVYDKVPERTRQFAAKYNCHAAMSFDELLISPTDAVTIATPSGLHAEVAIPAACAGKHILCEKPLEVTPDKADKLIRACASSKVKLSAVFQSRFSRAVKTIRKAIDAGRFGQPVLASASIRWYRTPEYYAGSGWRGTWALDGGGALMNQGIHTVDLLLYFNDDVAEVSGHATRRLHQGIEVEDTAVAMLKFRNDSLGTIEASTACAPGFPRRIDLSGTLGSVILEDDRITRWQFLDEQPEDEEIRCEHLAGEGLNGGYGDPGAISSEGHRRQLQELIDAILNGTDLSLPGSEGKRAMELIYAIYESARIGTAIRFQE